MNVYEIVTILATAGTAMIGVLDYLRGGGQLTELGRHGVFWFDHAADRAIGERPSEDELDAPIPRRVLRGRAL